MSWEPNTEENETRKTRDNLEDLKQAQFFNTSSINSSSITNSMGTSSNMSGFNFDVMGDIVEGITNSVNGTLGELYKILSGYVFITPDAGEANNTAVVNKIGNGTGNTVDKANLPQDGQLLTLRPQVGKSLILKNNAKTNLSYNGNLLLGSDITLTESESITLRYQNEIKYADAVSGVSENIGGWIVHSTGNGSGSGAWVNTATSPLNMDGNAIFFDLKVNNKKFILSSGNNLDYTVDVNGGAHNFYVDDLSSPKIGITETKLESNVPLDMNLNYVEFQEISTPSTPSANHGFIYAKDVSGVTTPMWSNSAGETSLFTSSNVAWSNVTIDVNKDMNQKQLTNLNAVTSTSNVTATGFIFNTSSGNPSKITSSATSDIMGFMVNGVEKGSFAKDGALDTIFEVAGNPSPMMKFSSTATGANRVIGTIQFDGLDLATPSPSRQTYALIYGWSRNVGASSKEGELQFNVMKSNVSTGIMKMDGTGLLPHADNTFALGSASLGWSEIRSKGNIYGSTYNFVTSSGNPSKITSDSDSEGIGFQINGAEKVKFFLDGFGDTEIEIKGTINPVMKFYSTATGADRVVGGIYFDGLDSAPSQQTYALIYGMSRNASSTAKEGEIQFNVMKSNSSTPIMKMDGTGLLPHTDDTFTLGSPSLGWSEIRSAGNIYGKEYKFVTTSGTAPSGNGIIYFDGTDIWAKTGSGSKSLSNIGSGGASGANQALNNLSGVSINSDMIPDISTARNLGGSTKYWGSGFISASLYLGSGTSKKIQSSASNDISITVPSTGDIKFIESSTEFFRCDGGDNEVIFSRPIEMNNNLLMGNNNITGINQLAFYETNQTITDDTGGMRFSLPDTQDTYDFSIDGNQAISIEKYVLQLTNSRIGMTEEIAPSAPSSSSENLIYVDSTSHHLTIRHSTGTPVDLESGGSSGATVALDNLSAPTLNVNINANNKSVYNLQRVGFDAQTTTFGGTAGSIWYSGSGTTAKIKVRDGSNTWELEPTGTGPTLSADQTWTGTNTFMGSYATTVFKTNTNTSTAYTLQLIQNANSPQDGRTLANIDFMAENSSSQDETYARISASSQDITNGTEDGLLQLGVMSGGQLINGIDIEGGNNSQYYRAKIGFFGKTPVARQQVSTSASNSTIVTALKNLGLFY
jgi:hypothetical protein